MGPWALIRRSLRFYLVSDLAVGLAAAVAVAVLVGSLTVGESVQESLRRQALERLGQTQFALTSESFFGEHLAGDLQRTLEPGDAGLDAPLIIVSGAARGASSRTSISHVNVLGITDSFWRLWPTMPPTLETDTVAVTSALAEELGVSVGDALVVSFGNPARTPMDSVFGRKRRSDLVVTVRLTVGAIIPAHDAGLFSLRGDQPRTRNVYMELAQLQGLLNEPGRVNTVLVGSPERGGTTSVETVRSAVAKALKLDDLGLTVSPDRAGSRFLLKSGRVLLSPQVVRAAERVAGDTGCVAQISSVYLANSLAKPDVKSPGIPYSIMAGLPEIDGRKLQADEIVLNRWAADDLRAAPGDVIEATSFVAGPRGELETTRRSFKVVGVVAMDNPDVDARLVPDFTGMTTARTLSDWSPPFPIDMHLIRPQDEQYWKEYRATPKAFVAPEVCRNLWLSGPNAKTAQSGWVTCIRIQPPAGQDLSAVAKRFAELLPVQLSLDQAGLDVRSVRTEALRSARATQDFGMLFLSMSVFLVAASVVLIILLMRLTIERRSSQIGIMMAVGFPARMVSRIVMLEVLLVLLLAALVGMPMGLFYAALIIKALGSFWSGAVGGFPLVLSLSLRAMLMGAASGVAVALLAVFFSLRRLERPNAAQLLKGYGALSAGPATPSRMFDLLGILCLAVAAALWAVSAGWGLLPTQIAFFLGGASCVSGILLFFAGRLRRRARGGRRQLPPTLLGLALSGASRNRPRSILTATLLACASFIIVTVATFGRDPSRIHPGPKDSPSGGFNLVVTTEVPVFGDLGTQAGGKTLGLSDRTTKMLTGAEVFDLRMSAGEDISCLNIQKASVPRVIGVPDALIDRGGFTFSAEIPQETRASAQDPWKLLNRTTPGGSVPALTDSVTAQWNLHKRLADVVPVPTPDGRTMNCRLVGLFSQSIFAGGLLIPERTFLERFGTDSGYRMFLIRTGTDFQIEKDLAAALRDELADFGVDVSSTGDLLASYARAQNTYLATFQTLGGLGLILGTFGLVAVLLRNVLERRSEFAMMLAVGFLPRQITRMVLMEIVFLLVVGVSAGSIGALVGALPQLMATGTRVNWPTLAASLLLTMIVGWASCVAAARASMRTNLLAALREE